MKRGNSETLSLSKSKVEIMNPEVKAFRDPFSSGLFFPQARDWRNQQDGDDLRLLSAIGYIKTLLSRQPPQVRSDLKWVVRKK